MKQTKDKRLSDVDNKLNINFISCQNCNMEFHTLHKEDKYCVFCVVFKGYKNPIPKRRRRRR